MLYLNKKGFVLINTVIVISLLLTISALMFRIIKNNMDISSMYCTDDDIYSINMDEEDIIYEFMTILNKKAEDMNANYIKEESTEEYSLTEDESYDEESVEIEAEYNLKDIESIEKHNEEKNYNYIFGNDFQEESNGNKLKYIKSDDKLIVKVYGRYDSLRIRTLKYIIKKEKIILVPTADFKDTNRDSDML